MDITQLQYFKIIAETESLTKASKILHISQPAMSAMLKKFEEELNVELFDRSPNRIHLNSIGKIALIHVNTILDNIEQMRTDLINTSQQPQTLSIAFCDPGVQWFCVPRFSLAYPHIKLKDELYEGTDHVQSLVERIYDGMITTHPLNDKRLQSLPFLQDRVYMSVCIDSELSKRDSIFIHEISAQPLLYPEIGGYFLAQIEKIITENNYPISFIKNDYNITQHLIRTTKYLAATSDLSKDLRNDGTNRKLIPVNDPELNVTFYISFLRSNQNKIKKFLEWGKCLNFQEA